ncbi:type-F conjugative transfer system mating-pair stabilization protein TraN [Pantoea sp. NPDC088449]|uniref:type-F conjugative transfer system mating-pair stabilization protein TraN n=1 Tax=Pantoea sp. NPDC088449 TaxID=3364392 RepID=UPI0037F50C86
MKRLISLLLILVSAIAHADDVSDAYNAGAGFAGSNKGQGTSAAGGTDPASVIPGYTASPPQGGYYGGVQGGDGGIGDKGQTELGQSEAGQAISDSSTKNPAVTIDPNADFIQNGKNAEANSGTIVDGTNTQCTTKTVSKSVFENYSCSADVSVQKSCTRDTVITGHYETQSSTQVIDIPMSQFTKTLNSNRIDFSFPVPAGVQILNSSFSLSVCDHCSTNTSDITVNGLVYHSSPHNSFTINLGLTQGPASGKVDGYWTNKVPSYLNLVWSQLSPDLMSMSASITIVTTVQVWRPDTSTPTSCPNDPGGKKIGSVCSAGGGDRQIVKDGQTYSVHSDCWQYTDTYLVSENTTGTCGTLISNANCTQVAATCSEFVDGQCSHKDYTYQCQTTYSSSGLLCGGNYICQSGSCDETNGAGDSGFDTAVAKLAGLASAGDDVKTQSEAINVRAFTGNAMSCRKAFAGFSNCCKDSGWGQDTGLSQCNSDEMAIGKAKAKKVTVSVGERCDRAVLGVCIQKSQVYCVFGGKLARIIQEQGRRDQLHVSFGSGDSPDCRGITVPELQKINFDLINFQDFYSDLMANQKIPDSATMVQQAKDRIAAQVNAQTGGK